MGTLKTIQVVFLVVLSTVTASGETWRGLPVSPENRCSSYSSKDYTYPQSVETRIVAAQGGQIYGPYTGRCFNSTKKTDIEHIVARSEAHDSGLCSATDQTKRNFARDQLNLTLAHPDVNRCSKPNSKCDKDATDWMPDINQCWFAATVVAVRLKYNLTIDRHEANALERVLSNCDSTEMIIVDCNGGSSREPLPTSSRRKAEHASTIDALTLWDDNRNGRITCAEARRHGIAPVTRGHPAYRFMRDADGDGVVCE